MRSIVLIVIIFIAFSCRKNTLSSNNSINPKRYHWTVDTLNMTNLNNMWGNSYKDIYVAGQYGIWHYDGEEWSRSNVHVNDVSSIFGFSANEMYFVGGSWQKGNNSRLKVSYDGEDWDVEEVGGQTPIWAIYGISPDSIMIGGYNVVQFFNGSEWIDQTLPVPRDTSYSYAVTDIKASSSGYFYLLMWTRHPDDLYDHFYFLKYLENKWTVIDSLNSHGIYNLWISPTDEIYANGNFMYLWNENRWDRMYQEDTNTTSISEIFGTSNENIWAVGYNSKVFHSNGRNLYEVKEITFDSVNLTDGWTDENNVFILGHKYPNSIIYHGILK